MFYTFSYQLEKFELFVIPHSKVLSLRERYSGDIINLPLPNINQNYNSWLEQTFNSTLHNLTDTDIEEIHQWAITPSYPLLEDSPINWEVAQIISY